jgi:hypothetical protein
MVSGLTAFKKINSISVENITKIVRDHEVGLQLKQAEKFREPTRFYSYLVSIRKVPY